jgi:hypothetical protein
MAFNKQSGPPASRQQLIELQELLERAGHSDFRDARGPMSFTQSQAGGKFTRDEAQESIDQLQAAEDEAVEPAVVKLELVKPAEEERGLQGVPTEDLAAELRRRGWTVTEG